jgi:hypothetical protein
LHQPLIITAKTYCHVATEEWAVMFPFFHKSVILITDHEDEYTRGRSAGEDPLGITAIFPMLCGKALPSSGSIMCSPV